MFMPVRADARSSIELKSADLTVAPRPVKSRSTGLLIDSGRAIAKTSCLLCVSSSKTSSRGFIERVGNIVGKRTNCSGLANRAFMIDWPVSPATLQDSTI